MPAYTTTEQPRPAPQPASERVQRYEVNLDKALELTPVGERLAELREERVRWIARYKQFVDDVDRGRSTPIGDDGPRLPRRHPPTRHPHRPGGMQMNVLTAPKFLRDRQPAAPALPTPQPREASPETTAFLDSVTRQREENAYLRAEVETLTRENKLTHERIRMLESELTHVRADRDFLTRHDASMMTSLRDIKALIFMAEERAKAEAYAPPGSGQQDHSQQADELAEGVAELAKKLAPELPNAQP